MVRPSILDGGPSRVLFTATDQVGKIPTRSAFLHGRLHYNKEEVICHYRSGELSVICVRNGICPSSWGLYERSHRSHRAAQVRTPSLPGRVFSLRINLKENTRPAPTLLERTFGPRVLGRTNVFFPGLVSSPHRARDKESRH